MQAAAHRRLKSIRPRLELLNQLPLLIQLKVRQSAILQLVWFISGAISAEASTEFANPEWGAEQVVGKPDAPGCGDYQFAWASAASDSIDTLEVSFSASVYPLEIVIHESYNPDQVVKVEVFDAETGGYYAVLQKNPVQVDRPCPYQLSIPVEGIKFKTNLLRITVDQSQLGLGWNEIDAVQLIGSINQPDQ